jgi:hypothetical protein
MAFASTGSAQPSGAGDACVGTACGLGGQIRGQIGEGLPLPISIAPARTGAFADITIQSLPATPSGLPLVGQGLGQPGQIKPTANATIMQTTAAPHAAKTGNPRAITLPPNAFNYDRVAEGSVGVVAFNNAVFAVQTNLIYDIPHPGTDANGNPISGLGSSQMYSAGGRSGAATVTYCAGAAGSSDTNWGGACTDPSDGVGVNGLARFTKTANQFGGTSTGRVLGTAKVFFNKDGLALISLPCTGCEFQLSTVIPQSTGVGGGGFGGTAMNPAFQTPTGVYTGTIGFNGTILGFGNANRGWTTYEIPEPSSILAASAGLLALFGCNRLVRRRSRS